MDSGSSNAAEMIDGYFIEVPFNPMTRRTESGITVIEFSIQTSRKKARGIQEKRVLPVYHLSRKQETGNT